MPRDRRFYTTILIVTTSLVLQLIFLRFASHYIPLEIYGNFSLSLALINGLVVVFLQPIGHSLDRFYNESLEKNELIAKFIVLALYINLLLVFLYILAFFLFYEEVYKSYNIRLVLTVFLFLSISTIIHKRYFLEMDTPNYTIRKLIEPLAKFLFPLLAYYTMGSPESLLMGMVLGYVILLSLEFKYVFFRLKDFLSIYYFVDYKKYAEYSFPFLWSSLFTWGISFSDRLFIDFYLGASKVGLYSLLASISGMGQIIGQVYFMYTEPKVLKAFSKNEKQAFKELKRNLVVLALVLVSLFLVILLLPVELFNLILESSILESEYNVVVLYLLIFSIFINVMHIAHHMYLKLIRKPQVISIILFIALILNLVGNLFIKDFGIIAAALSTIASYAFILIGQIVYIALKLRNCK